MNRRSVLAALGCAALLTWTRPARPDDKIEVVDARLETTGDDGAVVLSAVFTLSLTQTLRDAVIRGLPLYFLTELQIQRPRWYWFDRSVVSMQTEWRLSYHALTRQFRVASANGSEGFTLLEDALRSMSTIDRLPVARIDRFNPRTVYRVWVRMRLDTTRLPKPFQMTALTDRDWNSESEWKRFDFTVPTPTPAQ
ncbi:MAG: DUF4390 domain-containing protein [Lautropia sp.]